MSKFYTGVGSRDTPPLIGHLMTNVAQVLEDKGYTLRSGGAKGADTFFSILVDKKEIYIPWEGFDGKGGIVPEFTQEHENILKSIHPAYERLSQGAKKLHMRNINQVLGRDLATPSEFLTCWAETDLKGIPKGGTRTAWVLAREYGIPCFNMFNDKDYQRFVKMVKK